MKCQEETVRGHQVKVQEQEEAWVEVVAKVEWAATSLERGPAECVFVPIVKYLYLIKLAYPAMK